LTGLSKVLKLNHIWQSPFTLHDSVLSAVAREIKFAKEGKKARIIAKMNSLVDTDIIDALYAASTAGVKIELIVRGICCLRPGIKGLSENIRVMSVVDRFLEHSRIYYFRAGGSKKIYFASADWMPRNFYTRYEIAFPIKDPMIKKYVRDVILATSLNDNAKAWELQPDGTYTRVTARAGAPVIRSQYVFEDLAGKDYAGTVLSARQKN
jgi:polyphosphate kinase